MRDRSDDGGGARMTPIQTNFSCFDFQLRRFFEFDWEAILSDLTNWQMDTVVSPKRKVGLPSTDKVVFYWQMLNPGFCECLLCQEKYLQLKCSKKFHFKIFKIKTSCCWWCSQLEEDQPQRWSSLKTGPTQPWFNAVIKMWRNSLILFWAQIASDSDRLELAQSWVHLCYELQVQLSDSDAG